MTSLDRVIALEPGSAGRARRNVPNTLAVLDSHFPRFPVLPGVLILDSLAELGALVAGGTPGSWRLAGAARVRFRRYVQPGDQLEVEVEVTGRDGDAVLLRAGASVDGRSVATARELRLVPAGSAS